LADGLRAREPPTGIAHGPDCLREGLDHEQRLVEFIPRLRRYARALVGDAGAADDLVQETLARARAKLDLYREGTDLRAWLFTVMHTIHVKNMRAAHTGDPIEEPELLLVRDLEQAIGSLSAEERSVLLLVTLEGMTYEDVARTLGIPAGTVVSRLSRARKRLRALMLGEGRLKRMK
jgi:RNA polymerase sigma-70 factor, ECF subfamily